MSKKSNKINKKHKIKNKTLRKNRKSKNKISIKNKKFYKKGGTTIYYIDTDEVKHPDITYNGTQFFRKVFSKHPTEEGKYLIKVENTIIKILMEHPNPNIVKYYDINDRYIDMEEVNTFKSNPSFFNEPLMGSKEIVEIQEVMRNVKDFLQGLGIMYVDWKFDNIGKSFIDGKYKLFDFDACGLIDLLTKEWKLKPIETYWSYKQAIKNGSKTPKEIDDWSFQHNIIEEGNQMIQYQIQQNGGGNKISELEMNKCNEFCSNSYLEKYRKQFRETFKTNPYIKPKTDDEIEELLKNVNMNEKVNECKQTFCSPNCKESGKNNKLRYVCPACVKKFPEVKKLGAVTFCKYDSNI